MTPDWGKAPADATHYGPESKTYTECWYKKIGDTWYFTKKSMGFLWQPTQNPPTKNRFGRMVKRP